MKYIKRFNESSDSGIFEDIKDVVKICLEEYCSDYGMTIFIEDGYFFKNSRFVDNQSIKNFWNGDKSELESLGSLEDCIQVTIRVESVMGRLEIHLDENSQNLFDESIEMLKNQLNMITNEYKILQLPKELKSTFWQIQFLIVYK